MLYKIILALILSVSLASAQPDPRTLPAVDPASIPLLGEFTATGGTYPLSLGYAGSAIGMAADGQSLWVACHDHDTSFARISIPAIGGRATILEPCRRVDLSAVSASNNNIGGFLADGASLVLSAYAYYDANGTAPVSHWRGTPGNMGTGRAIGVPPGFVGGYMGAIPPEWHAAFGGKALTGQWGIPIVNRTSYGPSVSVFNPSDLSVPAKMLVGYPAAHQTLGPWNAANQFYGGHDTGAGVAFPAGTSSVLFFGMHSENFCYGTGTSNPALFGQPDGEGNVYCESDNNGKGTHGVPRWFGVWTYRAADLADVAAGTKQPWDVRPVSLTKLRDGAITSATYDPATRRVYAAVPAGETLVVRVFQIGAGSPPPPPSVDCVPGTPRLLGETKDQCVNGSRTVVQQWTRDGDVSATNGGQACSPIPYTRTLSEPCVVEPPSANLTVFTAVKTCRVTIQSQPPDQSGGWGVQFRWDANNFGSKDTSAPFERARDFPAGTYQLGAIWTKTGQTPVYVPTQTYECK